VKQKTHNNFVSVTLCSFSLCNVSLYDD